METHAQRIRTAPFAGYSLAFSPFFEGRLAVASAQHYGLVGNGRAFLLGPQQPGQLGVQKFWDTQDGLYDLAWSELHENQFATGSGDGSVKLWDTEINEFPIRAWHEHSREVFSVDWNNIKKDTFATSSWDGSIKLWSPEAPQSLLTIPAHTHCVYAAIFSPHNPTVLASCSGDGTLKIWDTRTPIAPSQNGPAPPALTVPTSTTEVLSLDWNKYQPFTIATGSVDRTIQVWDVRKASSAPSPDAGLALGAPRIQTCLGHEFAVRRVAWSPHSPSVLASASYDMTARVWDTAAPPGQPSLRHIHDLHTEFVVGCSWSLFEEGVLATCSWDHEVHLCRPLG